MRAFGRFIVCALCVGCSLLLAVTQLTAQQRVNNSGPTVADTNQGNGSPVVEKEASVEKKLQRMQNLIEVQQKQIDELRALVEGLTARDAKNKSNPAPESPGGSLGPAATETVSQTASPAVEAKLNDKPEVPSFSALKMKGDIRFRFETFRNQGFESPLLPPIRNRLRIRARLELKPDDCTKSSCFGFGLRLATGSFTDNISTNQTLTDSYERKPFSLDRAFVNYSWRNEGKVWGFELVGGKFEPTFRRTQMVWDDDINVEGASQSLVLEPKKGRLSRLALVGFQLPAVEVSSGNDGGLFGGQLQSDWGRDADVNKADVSAGYYSWNHPDQVLFSLGAASTQVNGGISNGAALTGGQNGDLGTTNRIIRDATGKPIGFLANFKLFDVLGNYVWQRPDDYRVKFTFDFVRNLSRRIDDEKNGYWASIEFHRTRCEWKKGKWRKQSKEAIADELKEKVDRLSPEERQKLTPDDLAKLKQEESDKFECDDSLDKHNDWMAGYTFTRIQQDAVLVPFNFSDILASNSRAHIATFAYVPRPRVVLQWTGLFSQRANKIDPSSPANRWLNRMQFDVIYKFK